MRQTGLILFSFILFISPSAWATTYYVDKSPGKNCIGNYSVATRQCNGTNGASFTTVQAAANGVVAGDTVLVRSGTYGEYVLMKASGKSGSVITFKAYPGESPLIDAKQMTNYSINWGASNDYIVWDAIEVTGGIRGGIYVRGNHNVIQNAKIHGNGPTVDGEIMLNWGDYNIVRNNEVYNGQNGIMIQDCNYSTIEYNYVHDCPGHTGIDFLPITTRNPQILWTGNNVRFNIVARSNRGIYSRYQQNNEYVNNILYDNTLTGVNFTVHPDGYEPRVYVGNTKVYNNTIVGNGTQGIDLVGTQSITIKNNIIAYNLKEAIRASSDSQQGLVVDYNLYFGNGRYLPPMGSHGRDGDPLFTNRSTGDFSLSSKNSAAFDVGVNLLSEDVISDFVGTKRPQGAAFDIGAFEFSLGEVPPPAGEEPPVSDELFIVASSGALTAPMRAVSSPDVSTGSYIETTTANSGQVVYNFHLAQPGTYKILAEVYAANNAADSFRVKMDSGSEDIWDLNPTEDPTKFNVWMLDEVTARGAGTFSAPEFDPRVMQLEAGTHALTIFGRSAGAKLASLRLVLLPDGVPTPTASPTPTPTPTASPTPTPTSTPKTRGKGVGRSK